MSRINLEYRLADLEDRVENFRSVGRNMTPKEVAEELGAMIDYIEETMALIESEGLDGLNSYTFRVVRINTRLMVEMLIRSRP